MHIALTHGMAPWEPFEKSETRRPAYRILQEALVAATLPPKSGEAAIVTTYRKTKASEEHYPNSAELLRAAIGTEKLSGGITEVDCAKYKQLTAVWSGSHVVPVHASWRHQVYQGELECPDNLRIPWLFTMDPMTYSEKGGADDAKLYRSDIDLLADVLTRYVQSGNPGIVALFVYAVMTSNQYRFWEFVDDLAKHIGAGTRSYWLPHRGGNHNLAGLLYSGIELSSDFKPSGLNEGRENIKI